jgi:hypothetical protein
MYSPRGHRVSNTMTNKKNSTKRRASRVKQKKATPFADAGAIVGKNIANMFGLPQASGVGRWLGQGIGAIFGSGDYQMVGQEPGYNVLANGKQIPKFMTNDRTNVICHREYLGDILSTTGFQNRSYPLNPTSTKTFPWLSQLAVNYQQFRFHGVIFEFRPMITDFTSAGQPGILVFATNYNANEPSFASKIEMENSEYAVSVKPTLSLIHAIECNPQETTITKLYTDMDADPRFTTLGNMQLATTGNASANVVLGELWVSYCVEFFKPKLVPEIGGVQTLHARRSVISTVNPLGTIQVSYGSDIPDSFVSGSSISFRATPGTKWLVQVAWSGDVTAVLATLNDPILSGASYGPWANQITGGPSFYSEEIGNTSRRFTFQAVITMVNDLVSMTFGSCFTALPTTNTQADVVICQLDRVIT